VGLNIAKGNMYPWVTHTWNTVKGACLHGCSYCYMKRWGKQRPAYFDKREMKTDLGDGNFIFVGSSCDMWAEDIPDSWISDTLAKCREADLNAFLFQSKSPFRFVPWSGGIPAGSILCTTIETNRTYRAVMGVCPRCPRRKPRAEGGIEVSMSGCELIRCPFYIGKKCTELNDYVNKDTGEDMCSLNSNAIPREEYEEAHR
jgi:hypothetical protein